VHPEADTRVDVMGTWFIPGFVDLHPTAVVATPSTTAREGRSLRRSPLTVHGTTSAR
jgi:imidazolonepropionase-like amidohydrolase